MSAGSGDSNRPIVALAAKSLPGTALEQLYEVATVRNWPHNGSPNSDQLAQLCKGADALLCTGATTVDVPLLEKCPGLSLISLVSVGYDNVDLQACKTRGIAVTNTPGVLDEATADLTWALILAVSRRVVQAAAYVRAGSWRSVDLDTMVGLDVHGRRLGIVGYGGIGKAVARRAAGFDIEVVHNSRNKSNDEHSSWMALEELLATSDIVSLHVPLTTATRCMIGKPQLESMKQDAVLINTSRGAVIDQPALIGALQQGQLFGAGLDVNALEPLSDTADVLLNLANCVVLPHIGSASRQARRRMADVAVANVVDYFAGKAVHAL